ncbi:cofactor-independent phosphoglycerate mutase [Lachnospiraceae bacterium ZAX-1]
MKYIIILGDGMADLPIESLGGKTPLAYAKTPNMDELASMGEIGMAHTIPTGMKPGSDTANLSVLGYDPQQYYSGRSPLEALSIGVDMKDTDVALRCNFVTLSEEEDDYEDRTILDHSSGEIKTEDAAVLLDAVKKELESESYHYYVGTSYRHLLIWKEGTILEELIQPHDVLGQTIGRHLPTDPTLLSMMKKSYRILVNHPINVKRKEAGLHPANSCWFWGAGTRPALTSFEQKNHISGAMVSAVDLLKGIAVGASMKNILVGGANGGLHTNYEGKASAAVEVLTKGNCDFVYVHVEAPDEMGHQGDIQKKIQAIEYLDARVIAPIKAGLEAAKEEFRMMILPDHPTPICIRTHTGDDVPYLLYDSRNIQHNTWNYNELEAAKSGHYIEKGHEIIDYLIEGRSCAI